MKKILLCCMLAGSVYTGVAQRALAEQDEVVKGKAIYFNYLNGITTFHIKNEADDQQKLTKGFRFSLKSGYSNIYMNWLNPLKYKISWKDSTFTDESEVATANFIKSLGFATAAAATGGAPELTKAVPVTTTGKINATPLAKPPVGIHSVELMQLYMGIQNDIVSHKKISEPELIKINELLTVLFDLDGVTRNVADSVEQSFDRMYKVTNPKEVEAVVKAEQEVHDRIKETTTGIISTRDRIYELVKAVTVTNDKVLEGYIVKVATNLAGSAALQLEKDKTLNASLQVIIDKMKHSLEGKQSDTHSGYFLVRDVSFEEGKVLDTEMTIAEYSYDKEKRDYIKKADVYQSQIKFRRADPVVVSVSAGVFYSGVTLNYYGVSTSGDKKVTEERIEKNTAVTATFLNLAFNMGSRNFAPLIQLGVDPTKKHPYFLMGGGFAIPSQRFSITGGAVWTWDAALNKLSVGSTVESTTDLEKDITYKFDAKPKGWYLGVQYNL